VPRKKYTAHTLYKMAESLLEQYSRKQLEKECLEEDILLLTPTREQVGHAGYFSDPTASKAVKLLSNKELDYLRKVLGAVDAAVAEATEDEKKIFEYAFLKGWHWWRMCELLACGRNTYYTWRKKLIWRVVHQLPVFGVVSWEDYYRAIGRRGKKNALAKR